MFLEVSSVSYTKRDKILIKHLSQVCTELPDGGKNMKCFQRGLMKLHTACCRPLMWECIPASPPTHWASLTEPFASMVRYNILWVSVFIWLGRWLDSGEWRDWVERLEKIYHKGCVKTRLLRRSNSTMETFGNIWIYDGEMIYFSWPNLLHCTRG